MSNRGSWGSFTNMPTCVWFILSKPRVLGFFYQHADMRSVHSLSSINFLGYIPGRKRKRAYTQKKNRARHSHRTPSRPPAPPACLWRFFVLGMGQVLSYFSPGWHDAAAFETTTDDETETLREIRCCFNSEQCDLSKRQQEAVDCSQYISETSDERALLGAELFVVRSQGQDNFQQPGGTGVEGVDGGAKHAACYISGIALRDVDRMPPDKKGAGRAHLIQAGDNACLSRNEGKLAIYHNAAGGKGIP